MLDDYDIKTKVGKGKYAKVRNKKINKISKMIYCFHLYRCI